MKLAKGTRQRELTRPEIQHILYWLRFSDISILRIAERFQVEYNTVKDLRDRNGLQNRYVEMSLSFIDV